MKRFGVSRRARLAAGSVAVVVLATTAAATAMSGVASAGISAGPSSATVPQGTSLDPGLTSQIPHDSGQACANGMGVIARPYQARVDVDGAVYLDYRDTAVGDTTEIIPPASFQARTATSAQLLRYNLPDRPKGASDIGGWTSLVDGLRGDGTVKSHMMCQGVDISEIFSNKFIPGSQSGG